MWIHAAGSRKICHTCQSRWTRRWPVCNLDLSHRKLFTLTDQTRFLLSFAGAKNVICERNPFYSFFLIPSGHVRKSNFCLLESLGFCCLQFLLFTYTRAPVYSRYIVFDVILSVPTLACLKSTHRPSLPSCHDSQNR